LNGLSGHQCYLEAIERLRFINPCVDCINELSPDFLDLYQDSNKNENNSRKYKKKKGRSKKQSIPKEAVSKKDVPPKPISCPLQKDSTAWLSLAHY
jgi:hypothetical protein